MQNSVKVKSTTDRRKRFRHGHFAEIAASLLLSVKGYSLLARRFRTPVGEIDLIAQKKNRLAFVEVKMRAQLEDALWAITPKQQRRIIQASQIWLQKNTHYQNYDLSFDAVLVIPWRIPVHQQNIFSQH